MKPDFGLVAPGFSHWPGAGYSCRKIGFFRYNVALNKDAYRHSWKETNQYADAVNQLYTNDSLITQQCHLLNNGKWNQMMSQTHIGYTYWQQPNRQKMPPVQYLSADSVVAIGNKDIAVQSVKRGMAIDADKYTNAVNTNGITWKILPDHGRTGSAITPFPVTASEQKPGDNSPHLQYDMVADSTGEFTIKAYCSPSLNFFRDENGLQYAMSVDDEIPQVVSLNKEDKTSDKGIWNTWVSENIIIKSTTHKITKPGKHTVNFWMVTPGVVLQKIVVDFGGLAPTYLGPDETAERISPK